MKVGDTVYLKSNLTKKMTIAGVKEIPLDPNHNEHETLCVCLWFDTTDRQDRLIYSISIDRHRLNMFSQSNIPDPLNMLSILFYTGPANHTDTINSMYIFIYNML